MEQTKVPKALEKTVEIMEKICEFICVILISVIFLSTITQVFADLSLKARWFGRKNYLAMPVFGWLCFLRGLQSGSGNIWQSIFW